MTGQQTPALPGQRGGTHDDYCHPVLGAMGFAPDDHVSVNWLAADGTFTSQVTTVAQASGVAAQHLDTDCWVSTAPLRAGITVGRGTAADNGGIRAVRIDVDVAPGKFSSLTAAEMFVEEMGEALGEAATVIVESGHGLQPGWRIVGPGRDWTSATSPEARRAQAIRRRCHRLALSIAEGYGATLDNVADASRVMRVPGTTNRKDPAAPVRVRARLREDSDEPSLTLDEIESQLDAAGIPEQPEDREPLDAVVSDPGDWPWAERTCPYAEGWLKNIAKDKPSARHPYLTGQAVHRAAAHRYGCLTEEDYRRVGDAFVTRFRTRLNVGVKRPEQRGEVTGALAWGRTKAATFTDEMLRAELGGHVHPGQEPPTRHAPMTLAQVNDVYRRELGADAVDLDVVHAVAAVAAAGMHLNGDPVWLLDVGGSGVGKTEILAPLTAAGAIMASSISSEGALLSGTSAKERAADAHGGMLRRIGARGTLVLKDVTTILSMQRDSRAAILAALREIYDGRWDRHLGSDGGQTLTWQGHCTVLGGVTTAWDAHHGVITAMGDRFLLIRPRIDPAAAGRAALAASGRENEMRAALAQATGGLLQHLDPTTLTAGDPPVERILALATVITWARTAVECDYRGDVVFAHDREAPTRFAKQLLQLWRGARLIGMDDRAAESLVERVAADSMPPGRAAVLRALLDNHGPVTTTQVARACHRPRTTTDQALQALTALGMVTVIEVTGGAWQWQLTPAAAGGPDVEVVRALTGAPGDVGSTTPSASSAPSAPF